MFILRRILKGKEESNRVLGDHYSLVLRSASDQESFLRTLKTIFERDHVADMDPTADRYTKNCYGFVVTESNAIPLYNDSHNYIMTSAGQTFDNLTNR